MDISLIMPFRILKFVVYVGKTYFEGSMSQNFDIGLTVMARVSAQVLINFAAPIPPALI